MQKTHILLRLFTLGLLLKAILPAPCAADIAFIGGEGFFTFTSDSPFYPSINSLKIGDRSSVPLSIDSQKEGSFYSVVINPTTGETLFLGANTTDELPLLYSGSVISSSLTASPPPISNGAFVCGVFDCTETAIIGGGQFQENSAFVYRWSSKTHKFSPIYLPETPAGIVQSINLFPDNTALIIGGDSTSAGPFVYTLAPGKTQAQSIELPEVPDSGVLYSVAISSDGTAIIGGYDGTNNQALLYKLTSNSRIATKITVSGTGPGDFSTINSIGITSNGVAVLAGQTTFDALLYRLEPNSLTTTQITTPGITNGRLNTVVIGTDNIAIIGGYNSSTNLPAIYRLLPKSDLPSLVDLPSNETGIVINGAIGTENEAILIGIYSDANPFIFTVPSKGGPASAIHVKTKYPFGELYDATIYSENGLYDIRRIRPYYYLEQKQAQNILQSAGL
jgi:hypothetical protein